MYTKWRIQYWCRCVFWLGGGMLLVSPADKNETEEDDTDDSTISARGDDEPFQSKDICPFHSSLLFTYELASKFDRDGFPRLQDLVREDKKSYIDFLMLQTVWLQRGLQFDETGIYGGADGQLGQGHPPLSKTDFLNAFYNFSQDPALRLYPTYTDYPQRFFECVEAAIEHEEKQQNNQDILNPLANLALSIGMLNIYLKDNPRLFNLSFEERHSSDDEGIPSPDSEEIVGFNIEEGKISLDIKGK